MFNFITRRNTLLAWLPAHLLVAAGFGALLGTAALVASSVWILVALLVGYGLIVALQRPEFILLAFLVLTASIVDDSQNPKLALGFGTLYLTDMIWMLGFALVAVRWLIEPDFSLIRTPLDGPLILFLVLVLATTIGRILSGDLGLNDVLGELRIAMNYALFFITTNLVREKPQISILSGGIIGLAVFVAVAMLLQYLVGNSTTLLPGRVENLQTEGTSFETITRVLPPGQSLIMSSFILLAALLTFDPRRAFLWLGLLVMVSIGLALTFNRNFWIGSALASGILVVLVYPDERRRLLSRSAVVLAVGSIAIAALLIKPHPELASVKVAVADRMFSLVQVDTFADQNSSLRWRDFEYWYAMDVIQEHPLTGIGMGAQYRPWVPAYDHEAYDGRAYLHNGHLWIMAKAGIPAYLAFMAFCGLLIIRSFNNWRTIAEPHMRAIVVASCLIYISVLLGSIVNSMVMQWYWTGLLGILAGVVEISIQQSKSTAIPVDLREPASPDRLIGSSR